VLAAFWEAVGDKLADRWAAISVPALIFWLGGLAAWTYHRGGLHTLGTQKWLDGQSTIIQAAVILTALLGVAASGILIARAATPALRLLEGYWPAWTSPLRRRLCDGLAERAAAEAPAWQRAQARLQEADPTAEDLAAYARLERRRRRRPASAAYFMPTPIGNILRAAERRPVDKYGLDTVAVWPHLWLLLPEATRAELRAARAAVDTAVVTAIWGILFCAFTPFTWLAVPIGLAIAAIAVTRVTPVRAQAFGELIEAAYDLHRTAIYHPLRWAPARQPPRGTPQRRATDHVPTARLRQHQPGLHRRALTQASSSASPSDSAGSRRRSRTRRRGR